MKTYQQLVTSFLYGPPMPVPAYINADISPKQAFLDGVAQAKLQLKKSIDDERGIEPPPSR